MKNRLHAGIFLMVFAALAGCRSHDNPLPGLNKLVGTWSMQAGDSELMEVWRLGNDTILYGESFEINGKDTLLSESVVLVSRGTGVYYIPTVTGQNDNKPVSFAMTSHTDSLYVFENPDHDFPQTITYRFVGDDKLTATVSGAVNDRVRTLEFPYSRKH